MGADFEQYEDHGLSGRWRTLSQRKKLSAGAKDVSQIKMGMIYDSLHLLDSFRSAFIKLTLMYKILSL